MSEIHRKTRLKFINAALELFGKRGYRGATIRTICQKTGSPSARFIPLSQQGSAFWRRISSWRRAIKRSNARQQFQKSSCPTQSIQQCGSPASALSTAF
ncbi:MAG: helix-turn-helix transcriptional regulator [Deltaproteobacteria bacterium]|nr:helix-turn-helix transcriptional regulator [Deltaproteobacteria bacterium]